MYIDHAIYSENSNFKENNILNDPEDASDHRPISFEIDIGRITQIDPDIAHIQIVNKIHNFKWTKEFTASYNKHLRFYLNETSIQQFRAASVKSVSTRRISQFVEIL